MSNTSNFSKLSTRLNPRSSGSKQFNRQTWSCCANYDIAVSLQVADRMRELKIRGDDQPWYPIGIYNFTLHGGVRSFTNFANFKLYIFTWSNAREHSIMVSAMVTVSKKTCHYFFNPSIRDYFRIIFVSLVYCQKGVLSSRLY